MARMWIQPEDFQGAEEDLTRALKNGASPIQCHLQRARIFDRQNNPKEAAKERRAVGNLVPADALDLVARGNSDFARMPRGCWPISRRPPSYSPSTSPPGRIRHTSWPTRSISRSRLSMPRTRRSNWVPTLALTWSGRAVPGPGGTAGGAHADAQRALTLSEDAEVAYQVACVYCSLLDHSSGRSRTGAEVRCRSLRDGYRRFDVIESDPDVKAIREHREFKDALTAAKTLRQ